MRRFNILFAFAFILLTSCFTDEVDYVGYQPSSKGGIHIVGAVEEYDVKSVGTRADDDDIADSYISEMTMFIFKDKNNNLEDKDNNKFELIQGYSDAGRTQACTSAINIQRGNPTFLIDTEEGILADLSGGSDTDIVYYNNDANDLGACDIYIVANAWHQLSAPDPNNSGKRYVDTIKNLADLEAFVYQADDTLAMPADGSGNVIGFPMIGKQQGGSFKLKKGDDNEGNAVATIPLKKLYSKVRFTMQINADQVVAGQTPKFTISKVEVFNVPKMARLGRDYDKDGNLSYEYDYTEEMGFESTYKPSDLYYYTNTAEDPPFVIDQFNKKTIYHSTSSTTDDIIEFGFYMPEHKVTPNPIQLPSTMTPEEKEKYAQYYKPTGVGAVRNGDSTTSAAKIATFVRIHGSYTDHNGQILGVTYDIYLGQNNSDDFTIKRNQLLNNKLIITGLTNHKGAYPDAEGNISIDHRVEVADRGFNLSMERTAILDAHFEVRPLDIELQPGATMTVTIPDAQNSWVAMEDDAVAYSNTSGLYVNTTTARKGVRKYFTTNLVKELNAAPLQGTPGNGGTIFFENTTKETKMFRIWFYVDENPNVYDKTGATLPADGYTVSKEQYRVCPVQFTYQGTKKDENGQDVPVTKEETINFQQWNLWRVWNTAGTRYYDIEHEEEYLNNYASDQQYGQTQNGMTWGLDGITLSNSKKAAYIDTDGGVLGWLMSIIGMSYEEWLNDIIESTKLAPYYDFYLERDTRPKGIGYRNYSGIDFNKEIAVTLRTLQASSDSEITDAMKKSAKIDGIILTEDPQSAFAYCYHKNKRDGDGKVVKQKWFLPAIDEIEEISMGAYDEFEQVFQNNKYWSCQPAAFNKTLRVIRQRAYIGNVTQDGSYMDDNTNRARATSVLYDPTNPNANTNGYVNISSEVNGNEGTYTLTITQFSGELVSHGYVENTGSNKTNYLNPNHPGNLPRTEKCRIRAVYRSGTK